MFKNKQEKTLGQMLDEDKGFIASRRLLMTLSILLLVSVFGGVSVKEANTFIFKLEFLNPKALSAILAIAVFACFVRYYAFSTPYHAKVRKIWCTKVLSGKRTVEMGEEPQPTKTKERIYKKAAEDGMCEWIGKDPGRYHVEYRPGFFLRRKLVLLDRASMGAEIASYNLREFTEQWTCCDFLYVLKLESRSRWLVSLQNREYLDVLFPYWVASAAVVSYMLVTFFPAEFTSLVQGNFQQLWLPRSV